MGSGIFRTKHAGTTLYGSRYAPSPDYLILTEPVMSFSVGIVIPTFQAAKHLKKCLTPLLHSSLSPRILVIDSSSTDGTVDIAREMGVETLVIPQREFNHGTTREMGRKLLNTSIVVMLTQDAYATSPMMLERLVQPLIENKASIAYARQVPHEGAGIFGRFAREFNYPSHSHIRSLKDVETYGVYTFFCSNSCAAYLNTALDEIGGFPSVLFGEDTAVVASLLHRKHTIAYVAEAEVQHSHDYRLKEEFCRHFDMGMARHTFRHLLAVAGSDRKRGKAYVQGLLNRLWKQAPFSIPYALLQTLVKFCGYHVGKRSENAPLWFKKKMSSQKAHWSK